VPIETLIAAIAEMANKGIQEVTPAPR